MAQTDKELSALRRVELTVRPESRFPVPVSDGYGVYGALLSALSDVDETVSERVHDSPFGSLRNSGLLGVFGGSDRRHHKTVRPDEQYRLSLGIVDPADTEIFQGLVRALVLEGNRLTLTNGDLHVESFESENATHEDLLEHAGELEVQEVELTFQTPACIEDGEDVTTMFPHRVPVFHSLLGKWNRTCPDDLKLDLPRDAVRENVIEKPDARTFETHSVLVNRVEGADGNPQPIFRQGFTGTCGYAFKTAPEAVENAVVGLGLFAEYSGIGSAIARGCGDVEVGVSEG